MEVENMGNFATQLMQDIRSGAGIPAEVVKDAYRYPQIDYLRKQVREADLTLLLDLARTQGTPTAALALGLLQPFRERAEVDALLRSLWDTHSDFEVRYNVLFRLLDSPTLDPALHDEVYEFVISNLDSFIPAREYWYGGPQEVLESIRNRLADPAFPNSKAWVYLCSAVASSDEEGARTLIVSYLDSPDHRVARTAETLLARKNWNSKS